MRSDCDKFIGRRISAASGRATLYAFTRMHLLETGASHERDFEGIARSRDNSSAYVTGAFVFFDRGS